jgi:hypothetical protein
VSLIIENLKDNSKMLAWFLSVNEAKHRAHGVHGHE